MFKDLGVGRIHRDERDPAAGGLTCCAGKTEGIGEDWRGGYLESWTTVMDSVVGKSVSHHHHHHHNFGRGKLTGGVRRYRDNGDRLSNGEVYGDKWIMEVDWEMGSIYLRDPRADRAHLII